MRKYKLVSILVLLIAFLISGCGNNLPKPTPGNGYQGEVFGIDKNINMDTIDKYLFREDIIYRDVRMLVDPAQFENIDGDSYLSGFIRGFEIVSLPFIIPVSLPATVGNGYQGPNLFTEDYFPNYLESLRIIEDLFPQNKKIFIMCGGGGYAKMMKDALIALGWDKDMIYNIGGYWSYRGKNNIEVKRIEDEINYYDFWKVPYHEINFDNLRRI